MYYVCDWAPSTGSANTETRGNFIINLVMGDSNILEKSRPREEGVAG